MKTITEKAPFYSLIFSGFWIVESLKESRTNNVREKEIKQNAKN
ncbi:hypothetical protein [Bacillus sp. V5-8f]|nr:hypothetical protein [Bacillus sp. V5-8f]